MTRDDLALLVLVVACVGIVVAACGMAIGIVRELCQWAPVKRTER